MKAPTPIATLASLLLTVVLNACGNGSTPAPSNPTLPGHPPTTVTPPAITPANGLIFSAPTGAVDAAQTLMLTNAGEAAVNISGLTLSDTSAFELTHAPTLPLSLAAGETASVSVGFSAGALGPQRATLTVESDAAPVSVALGGLSFAGTGGNNEPSLQWIMDTFAFQVDVGDGDPSTTPIENAPANELIGEEIAAQTFQKVGSGPVTLEVLAAYAVENDPMVEFGWYGAGIAASTQTVFDIPRTSSSTPPNNTQRVLPLLDGETSFDPGSAAFGLFSSWPGNRLFDARTTYTENALNTFSNALPHHVRTYPLTTADGSLEPNAYIVATNAIHFGDDFNDIVVVIRNVQPVVTP